MNASAAQTGLDQLLAQMPQAVWRANEMAQAAASVLHTGYAALDAELPGAGWARSCLTELLLPHPGIGEMQLLKPALTRLSAERRIVLIQPPYIPHAAACQRWGWQTDKLLWIAVDQQRDALWAAEQILRSGSCGGLLLWQDVLRPEALRRLNLAVQAADTWCWLLRPDSVQQQASPAALRLLLAPDAAGLQVQVIKRRGPHAARSLLLDLPDMPMNPHWQGNDHVTLDLHSSAVSSARSPATLLV